MKIWPLKKRNDVVPFHIPEACWQASRKEEIFVEDDNGDIWQVLDCTGPECLDRRP